MRKIILAVLGVAEAIFGLFGVQLGLSAQASTASLVGGLLIIAAWLFTEFKMDWKNFTNGVAQFNQWSDPSFWTAAIGSLLVVLTPAFGFTIADSTIAVISAILSILVPIFVGLFRKTEEVPVEVLRAKLNFLKK